LSLNNTYMLKEVFKKALNEKYAIGQFNFSTLEQLQGIFLAGKKMQLPLICGTSPGEADFFGMEEAVSMVRIMREKHNIPVFLNLDHGSDINKIKKAVDVGYDMVHFDGSKMSLEESIEVGKEVVSYAKRKNVVVEGEIAEIKGSSVVSDENKEQEELMEIEKVVNFIKQTGIDCIALDIGSFHGIHKNKPKICPERVLQLNDEVSCFVVLHGGSGIEEEDLRQSIKNGVVKVNINTELRLAWKEAVEKEIKNNPNQIVPYKILPFVRDAVCEKVIEKMNIFMKR
jgi:fructose-bisphosphate aldolase, class II